MYYFRGQGDSEDRLHLADDCFFEPDYIGPGGFTRQVDDNEGLGLPQGCSPFGERLASGFVYEPCRRQLGGAAGRA